MFVRLLACLFVFAVKLDKGFIVKGNRMGLGNSLNHEITVIFISAELRGSKRTGEF